jgi:5-methylthioadenosine/S-adenosylhomocysteine deaminase
MENKMNIRFLNAKILKLASGHQFEIVEGQLWVSNNEIIYIGDGVDVEQVADGRPIIWERDIDVKGNLLMPGFKNAHTHTAMTFLRSYADDLPLQEWLTEQVFPNEAKLSGQDVYDLSILGYMEYLTSGITANFDMYLNPYDIARASSDFGFRTVQVSGLNDFGGTVENMEECYEKLNHLDELNSYCLGVHAEYTTSLSLLEKVAQLAQEKKAPVFLHNSETEREVLECKARYGISPTQLMEKIGMHQYGGGGYHCVWFDEEDMDIFAKRNLSVVTNPASNLKLASGIAPIQEYLNRGINIAIGTDGPASNNCLDMFREMYLVTGLAKIKGNDASHMPAEEVLYMATVAGAHAMGLFNCDCLEVGKKADLIMIDLQQPNMQPENNIIKNIVYSGSKQNVKMTMINGKILYEDGKFYTGFDPGEVYAKANAIVAGLK